jgi:flagellar basal body-associated protein FliL
VSANRKEIAILIITIIVLLIFLIMGIKFYQKVSGKGRIKLEQVVSMEIFWGNESKYKYTRDTDIETLKNMVNAYNEAKLFKNNVGTTHSSRIEILLDNNEKIVVAGGSQGFQTVVRNGKQFNIKGDKLWRYFKQQHN